MVWKIDNFSSSDTKKIEKRYSNINGVRRFSIRKDPVIFWNYRKFLDFLNFHWFLKRIIVLFPPGLWGRDWIEYSTRFAVLSIWNFYTGIGFNSLSDGSLCCFCIRFIPSGEKGRGSTPIDVSLIFGGCI